MTSCKLSSPLVYRLEEYLEVIIVVAIPPHRHSDIRNYRGFHIFILVWVVLADRVRPDLFVGFKSHKCSVDVMVLRDPIKSQKYRGHGQSAEAGVGQLRPRLARQVIFKDPQPQSGPRSAGCW